MVIHEELLWILDAKEEDYGSWDEDRARRNIEFVHSMGRKCDVVGWSRLDLADPEADRILDEIRRFCASTGMKARGVYTRTFEGVQSDWFKLVAPSMGMYTGICVERIPGEDGGTVLRPDILAYKETKTGPKREYGVCVPERFRDACLRLGLTDVDFCWVRDKGRYRAEQYFSIYARQQVPRVARGAFGVNLYPAAMEPLTVLGGKLPKIREVFSVLQQIILPDQYLSADLPGGGIAGACSEIDPDKVDLEEILIHRETAELLVREKALSWKDLTPIPVVSECPAGYLLDRMVKRERPVQSYRDKMLREYEELKAHPRPIRRISEKEALKTLRRAKRDRKKDFTGRMRKELAEQLVDTAYQPLLPYYLISDGGQLSNEYRFLSYADSRRKTEDFRRITAGEELLDEPIDGIVLAGCTDGDTVLFRTDGTVCRVSHETPEIDEEWQSPAQFFFDAVAEQD